MVEQEQESADVENMVDVCLRAQHSGWDGWGSQTILMGTEIGSDSHAFMSAIKGEVVRYCRRYFSSYAMPAHRLMGHFPPFIH